MSLSSSVDSTSTSCHVDRRKDKLYTMLAENTDEEMKQMLRAVKTLIQAHSTHPDVDFVFDATEDNPCVSRAIILYAMTIEPEFMSYMLERPDVDAATVSEFTFKTVVPCADELMNGRMSLEYFVTGCLLEYVTM